MRSASCARRLPRRAFECRRFGFGMITPDFLDFQSQIRDPFRALCFVLGSLDFETLTSDCRVRDEIKVQSKKHKVHRNYVRNSFNLFQRESITLLSHWQLLTFPSIPQIEQRPLQSSWHKTCPGKASRISSRTTSSKSMASPSKTARFKSSSCSSCCSSARQLTVGTNLSANSE